MVSRKEVISGLFWRFGERIGVQIVTFFVSIAIARALDPSDYGVIAMVNVFIAFAQCFIENGFATALIQKKKTDNVDYSTVYYVQLLLAVFLYLILFFSAPFISKFYGEQYELLTPILRVLGLRLFLSSLNNAQCAYVSKHMMFKKFFFATLIGTLISAVVGIAMAYTGFGVWSLVAQYLTNSTIDVLVLWFTVKWRPQRVFSVQRLKSLFNFGWKMLVSALINTGYEQLRSLLIGKFYSSSDLAYFDRGQSYPYIIVGNINSSIDGVLFPTLSQAQDDISLLKNLVRRAMRTSTYVMAPLLIGLAACGKSLISILLTDKWLPAYPFMVIFCITYIFYPINTSNLNAIKAMGRSDLYLKLEVIKKVIGILALILTLRISVKAFACSALITSVITQIINTWPNKKLLNYSYIEQLKDIIPHILIATFMGGCVYCINFINFRQYFGQTIGDFVTIGIQVMLGGIIYIGLSAVFKIEPFIYLLNIVKQRIKK